MSNNNRGSGQPRRYSAWEWAKGYVAWVLVLPIYLGLWAFASVLKRLPTWATKLLLRAHIRHTTTRAMDFRIPPDKSAPAYMERWWRIPRNAFFNIYYHIVLRSDDDRALHDHPWWNFSIVLEGGYYEHTIDPGGVNKRIWYGPGSVKFRRAGTYAHRLELAFSDSTAHGEKPVRTIFITGPVLRRWGFHHPDRWVDAYEWDAFLDARGIAAMRMDGGSDAVQSDRNKI